MNRIEQAVIDLDGEWPTCTTPRVKGGYYILGDNLYKDRVIGRICDRAEFDYVAEQSGDGILDQAQAWRSVIKELCDVVPETMDLADTGEECALKAIQILADDSGRTTKRDKVVDDALEEIGGIVDVLPLLNRLYDTGRLKLPDE